MAVAQCDQISGNRFVIAKVVKQSLAHGDRRVAALLAMTNFPQNSWHWSVGASTPLRIFPDGIKQAAIIEEFALRLVPASKILINT